MGESSSIVPDDSTPTDPKAVQRYLHQHIPISRQMGMRVVALEPPGVTLCAPLTPNLNHEATAFGGSTPALAILTGWTRLYVRLWSITEPRRIVIQRSAMQYIAPIADEFCATAAAPACRLGAFSRATGQTRQGPNRDPGGCLLARRARCCVRGKLRGSQVTGDRWRR